MERLWRLLIQLHMIIQRTTTVEKPTTLSNSYAIYNTGASYQTMFTLGNGYGTPSSATNYITDSTGAKISNPKIKYNTYG